MTLTQLVAVGIGDAYALPFEYRKGAYSKWADLNDGAHYEVHPVFYETTSPGRFSDDTQMSIAVAETLLQGDLFCPEIFGQKFVTAYQRNPHAGYSRGMSAGFDKAIAQNVPIGDICADFGKTEKSGAAMRATPLGLLPNLEDVRAVAWLQGTVTHEGDGLVAAEMAAMAAHYAYYRLGERSQLWDWLRAQCDDPLPKLPWRKRVGSPGMDSTLAALTAVVEATSLRDLLVRCVAFTGDVDTVAAIAMGVGCFFDDLPNNLSPALLHDLENGDYGRDWMRELDLRLMAKYPRPAA